MDLLKMVWGGFVIHGACCCWDLVCDLCGPKFVVPCADVLHYIFLNLDWFLYMVLLTCLGWLCIFVPMWYTFCHCFRFFIEYVMAFTHMIHGYIMAFKGPVLWCTYAPRLPPLNLLQMMIPTLVIYGCLFKYVVIYKGAMMLEWLYAHVVMTMHMSFGPYTL